MEASFTFRSALQSECPFRYTAKHSLGVPHAVTQSDIYKGYYIPKGMSYVRLLSTYRIECCRGHGHLKHMVRSSHTCWYHHSAIHYSRRAMSRDEARYPDANKFMPERFLNTDGMLIDDNLADFIFGFGRRICPGWSPRPEHKQSAHTQAPCHYQAVMLQMPPSGALS